MTNREILYLVLIFVATLLFWWVAVNKLNAISIHPTLAKSRHISVHLIEDIFAVLIALVVTLSIKWIGILLINALLILPAASARNISCNMREYHGYAILFSVFSGLVGLVVSYFTNVATGPMIVIVASVIYFATYMYGKDK
jgi:zinc transport system permease protein